MRTFDVVVAVDKQRGIGRKGELPWKLPADMEYFKNLTGVSTTPGKRHAVIMGRKTWESLPDAYRPLPNRLNVVLTTQESLDVAEGVLVANRFGAALGLLQVQEDIDRVFVIGGGVLYAEALQHEACGELYVTHVGQEFECDVFFPDFADDYEVKLAESPCSEGDLTFQWVVYKKKEA